MDVEFARRRGNVGKTIHMPATISLDRQARQREPVVARMPISIAARTPHASSAEIKARPKTAIRTFLSRRLPSVTGVAALGTTIPALRNPIMAMKSPMPAATAEYRLRRELLPGSTLTHADQREDQERRAGKKRTAPSAVSHGTPIPLTTV